jgi:hypothetical protein
MNTQELWSRRAAFSASIRVPLNAGVEGALFRAGYREPEQIARSGATRSSISRIRTPTLRPSSARP